MSNSLADKHNRFTKDLIINCYIELMKTKPVNKITVTDICKAAEINRGTFYLHYEDVAHLANQIDDALYNELADYLEKSINTKSVEGMLESIFNAIKEHSGLCKIYLSNNGNSTIIKKLTSYAFELYKDVWTSDAVKIMQYVFSYTTGGAIEIFNEWLSAGMKESPQEMAKITISLIEKGVDPLQY